MTLPAESWITSSTVLTHIPATTTGAAARRTTAGSALSVQYHVSTSRAMGSASAAIAWEAGWEPRYAGSNGRDSVAISITANTPVHASRNGVGPHRAAIMRGPQVTITQRNRLKTTTCSVRAEPAT